MTANTVQINFDQSKNALDVSVNNLAVSFSMHFHCHESFLSVSGDASASGPVNLSVDIALSTLGIGNELYLPQINVPSLNLDINKHSFNIDINCHNCPGFVEDALQSLIKDFALPAGAHAAQGALPAQIKNAVNPAL